MPCVPVRHGPALLGVDLGRYGETPTKVGIYHSSAVAPGHARRLRSGEVLVTAVGGFAIHVHALPFGNAADAGERHVQRFG